MASSAAAKSLLYFTLMVDGERVKFLWQFFMRLNYYNSDSNTRAYWYWKKNVHFKNILDFY